MSVRGLQTLLIIALTDRRQADALLRGNPTAYEGFDLSAVEIRDLMNIQAKSLAEFAQQAHWLLYKEDLSQEPDPPVVHHAPILTERPCA
jgi:hypothetical protein